MATTTADGTFTFSQTYNGTTLHDWINQCHKALAVSSGWEYKPLKPGMFGYDNLAHSIGRVFSTNYSTMSIDELANLVHQGWITNYIYWRDNNPFETNPLYFKPGNPLGDERRNLCANTSYKDLPKDEQNKDLIIAQVLKN